MDGVGAKDGLTGALEPKGGDGILAWAAGLAIGGGIEGPAGPALFFPSRARRSILGFLLSSAIEVSCWGGAFEQPS